MAVKSNIEWTDATWNPIRARNKETGKVGWFCEHVSPACDNCYAEGMNINTYFGNGLSYKASSMSKLELFLDEKTLMQPLTWRKPQKIFPCSMTDIFARFVPDQWITDIFGVMALAHWHTFQVLTKRPERALQYMQAGDHGIIDQFRAIQEGGGIGPRQMFRALYLKHRDKIGWAWPLPNVWLGVSCEDQKTADERIPLLLQTPAAVRFISAEPLLGPINLTRIPTGSWAYGKVDVMSGYLCGDEPDEMYDWQADPNGWIRKPADQWKRGKHGIDWVIVGGESGSHARTFNVEWAQSIIEQCKAAGVPVFMKQLGAQPVDWRSDVPEAPPYEFFLSDRKGGDIEEWPEDLRVRQFPTPLQR